MDHVARTAVAGAGASPLVMPLYGSRSLSDLLPSVVSAVWESAGLNGTEAGGGGVGGVLGLLPTRRAVVLLVDGLGWNLLRDHPDEAPFLTSLLGASPEPLTVGFPATTATSLASLGTGLPPGQHGMTGYEIVVPPVGWVMNALAWDARVDPLLWQPEPTWFERAAVRGIAVTRVGPKAFDGTGLTEAALRGGVYAGAESVGERVAAVAAALSAALSRNGPALVYCYYGDLDATGHRQGCESDAWRFQLAHADRLAEQLADCLPPGTTMWVTADHGMVDVGPYARLDAATTPALSAGVDCLAGEPRARHVHALPGASGDVLSSWVETLGSRALVLSRADAVAQGWFGPVVSERVLPRIGDVVAMACDELAVVDSRSMSVHALGLVGLHGSVTSAEVHVPLLEVRR